MTTTGNAFEQLLNRGQPTVSKPQAPTPMEGIILDVFDTTATFYIPEYDPHKSFGPSPFGISSTPPVSGNRCLVLFIGNGIDRAWISAWAPAE